MNTKTIFLIKLCSEWICDPNLILSDVLPERIKLGDDRLHVDGWPANIRIWSSWQLKERAVTGNQMKEVWDWGRDLCTPTLSLSPSRPLRVCACARVRVCLCVWGWGGGRGRTHFTFRILIWNFTTSFLGIFALIVSLSEAQNFGNSENVW